MRRFTRRQVLKGTAATLASFWLPGAAFALRPRPPFAVLPARRPEPGLIEAELFAVAAPIDVAGTTARLLTYNGSFPGPLLELTEGTRVRLRFTNLLDRPTNLHFHGLHIPPDVDDPFLAVPPGETTRYEFSVPMGCAGTYWYHPHLHGEVAEQLFAGLAGPIIVRGRADFATSLRRAEEYLLVLKDLSLDGETVEAHRPSDWFNGKEGRLLLANGTLQPRLTPRHALIRLRLLNASNARYYRLALEQHELCLIASDAGLLREPVPVSEVLLAPGERAEALVSLERAGEFRLLNLPYARGGGHMHGMGLGPFGLPPSEPAAPQTLLTIANRIVRARVPLPKRLARIPSIDLQRATSTRRFVLGEAMMGRGFLINGRTFDPHRVDVSARLGDVEIWEIENRGAMDHPFHLHTYPFQVIARDGEPPRFRAWKDVVNVRPGEVARIAVPLADFRGRTVYHCHIVEHEDQGMMGILEV